MNYQYKEDDLLMLSGIQHMAFCERQWALIHIEKQWHENVRTVEGRQIHEKVDDPEFFESRGDILISRSIPIISHKLGLYGVADMVQFHRTNRKEEGILIENRVGRWIPVPIEYKRGRPKDDAVDDVQLCAQAIALEEMLHVSISRGYIYYAQTRHRIEVKLDEKLRAFVQELALKMHDMFQSGITPNAVYKKHCKNCSLYEVCMPKITSREKDVARYIQKFIEMGEDED